jgi:hypothetical protein
MKEKNMSFDPLYNLGSKFNLTLMRVVAFSLGLWLGPNLKPNVVTVIFFLFTFT